MSRPTPARTSHAESSLCQQLTQAVDLGQLRPGLERPGNAPFAWQAYNCIENHDRVLDRHMGDFHRFTRDLIWLRRRHPALRSDPITVYPPDAGNRIIAFQRWVPGVGRDVVVVASLNESSFYDHSYALGLPQPGHWHEVFNGDFYDYFPNPAVQGNPGGIDADGPPVNGLSYSGRITIPANSLLVFARDLGD